MAILEIPVRSDIPAYQFQISLDGTTFTLHFRFNTRLDRWVMDIHDIDDVEIIQGAVLLYGLPLFDRYKIASLPVGRFILSDETGEERNPGRDDLGDDFKLLYQEASV